MQNEMTFDEKFTMLLKHMNAIMDLLIEIKGDTNTVAFANAIRADIVNMRLEDHEALTIKEASRVSKISIKTLYKYRDKGDLMVKHGENMKEIILREDLVKFLHSLPYTNQ